jgi:phage shock protein C
VEGTPTPGADPRSAEERPPAPAKESPPPSTAGQPAQAGGGGLAESRTWLGSQGLARPRRDRMIAGVCAGLARRYGMPVFLVRVLTVAAGLAGFGVLVYLVLWVLMPKEG